MYSKRFAGLKVVLLLVFASGATKAVSQDISGCLCAMLKKKNVENSIDDIRQQYSLTVDDIQDEPSLLAPFIQKHIINGAASSCSVTGKRSGTEEHLIIETYLSSLQRSPRPPRLTQCLSDAESKYQSRLFGGDQSLTSLLNLGIGAPILDEAPDSFSFLRQDMFSQSLNSARIEQSHQAFADDLLRSHLYFSGKSSFAPQDAIERLAPWAFPQWPSGMTTQDMSMGAFLEMINPNYLSFANLALSLGTNSDSPPWPPHEEVFTSDWSYYGLKAANRSHYYSPELNEELLNLLNRNQNSEPKDSPRDTNNFEHARNLLCGQRPSLETSSLLDRINASLLQANNQTSLIDAILAEYSSPVEGNYQECLEICNNPLFNYGPECLSDCLLGIEDAAATVLPDRPEVLGICEDMNATYREACLRNLAAEHNHAVRNCEIQFGESPTAPEYLDFAFLKDSSECQNFSEATAYLCRRYFEEQALIGDDSISSSEDIIAQCVARYCGSYSVNQDEEDPDRDSIGVDLDATGSTISGDHEMVEPAEAAKRVRDAQIAAQIEISKSERREIVVPAIQKVAGAYAGIYSIRYGRAQPQPNGGFPSNSHLFGGAQDIIISRVDGGRVTPEDYETVAAAIGKELPVGFNVISELSLSNTFTSGLDVVSVTPSEITFGYIPLTGIERDNPTITVPANEVGVLYFHSGKYNSTHGVEEFFRYKKANVDHIHIGRPSKSLPDF